jgi:CRP-like cAMP-binding protein
MTRPGYLRWRTDLQKFHAKRASEILSEAGYPPETITRVQELILKRNFPRDPQARVLEDALCLVFLEHQFAELAEKTPEEKIVQALVKAWNKMTPAARALAADIPHAPRETALLQKALGTVS